MSVGYNVFIKAPRHPASSSIIESLLDRDAITGYEPFTENTYFADRWILYVDGIPYVHILNLINDSEANDPENDYLYGFDYQILIDLPFSEDNEEMRKRVLSLATSLALEFEVVVDYDCDYRIVGNQAPGSPIERLPEWTDEFKADSVDLSELQELLSRKGSPIWIQMHPTTDA